MKVGQTFSTDAIETLHYVFEIKVDNVTPITIYRSLCGKSIKADAVQDMGDTPAIDCETCQQERRRLVDLARDHTHGYHDTSPSKDCPCCTPFRVTPSATTNQGELITPEEAGESRPLVIAATVQHDDNLYIEGGPSRLGNRYYVATLAGCELKYVANGRREYGPDYTLTDAVTKSIERDVQFKRRTHFAWIGAEATILSATPIPQPHRIELKVGDVIEVAYEGLYRIVVPFRHANQYALEPLYDEQARRETYLR